MVIQPGWTVLWGSYTDLATQKDVLSYYQAQLTKRGWRVAPVDYRGFPLHLEARRDGFAYTVFFLDAAQEGDAEGGTRVHIQGGPIR